MGGWRILAREYRANSSFDGQKLWLKSATMRWWTNYNNCVNIGANKYGLYLSVLPVFRVGHPPLFMPWMDISTEVTQRRFLPDVVKFNFTRQPEVPVILSKKLAAKIFSMRQDSQQGISV